MFAADFYMNLMLVKCSFDAYILSAEKCLQSFCLDRVPTELESQGIKEVREKSGNFVSGQGKIARIVRLSNCCRNIISGQKHD